jgi:hypothetical protein
MLHRVEPTPLGELSRGGPGRHVAALALLVGVVVALGPGAVGAVGQTPDSPTPAGPTEVTEFDPDLSAPVAGTQPAEEPSEDPISTEDPTMTTDDEVSNEMLQQPGWGRARDQTTEAKRSEAAADCAAEGVAPPISKMLGLPGAVAVAEADSLGWLILVIAVGALVVAGIAFAVRRRRGASPARGPLESVATVVGILGVIAGLAVQFVPGVGVREAPAPAVKVAVSDVNPRITQAEYADKTHSKRPSREDRREVGNVIWLEIHLEGYRDKELKLQYALFDPDAGGALLPGTAVTVPVPRQGADVETQFLPIWVGYPLSERFEAAFRVLDGRRVQALAATGKMKASKYRYSCGSG